MGTAEGVLVYRACDTPGQKVLDEWRACASAQPLLGSVRPMRTCPQRMKEGSRVGNGIANHRVDTALTISADAK